MAQIEGRCHRDGRFAPACWAYADATVEEKIARVAAGRLQAIKEMIGDDIETCARSNPCSSRADHAGAVLARSRRAQRTGSGNPGMLSS
jgi:hypothetical protein